MEECPLTIWKSASFSAYEEFCSNYDLLSQDVAILRRSIPNWSVYDQGIEALSKSVASVNSRRNEENKSMSMGDLMIKVYIITFFFIQALTTQQPIQRLCKYPLLLQDLLRYTPVSDCPTSHDAIRQILDNIRILVTQINSATGNPVNKDRIHKTLLLQEKIRFADSVCLSPIVLRVTIDWVNEQQFMLQDVYKDLGPMILCGVLHVTYQTSELITGDFMVCVLFNNYFLIAKVIEDSHRLEVIACIYMDDLKMDTIQNGRGK